MQLILGSVRLHNAKYAGAKTQLVDKRRLLRGEEFETLHEELEPFMNSLL
jgi:hypothetical protein